VTGIDDWLRARGGVAHSSALHDAGFSTHRIAGAVAAGSVVRVRRSWLTIPEADAAVIAAAEVGGRLTCVSAAARRGLWVPRAPSLPHVAVAHSSSARADDGIRLHRARAPVPLHRTDPHEHVLNVMFHVARCLPRGDALAVWESALRTGAVDAEVLARVQWRSTRAAELAEVSGSLSDSGIETAFAALMRSIGIAVRQQVWIDGHPLDGLIGARLAVQLDGFAHHQGRDRRRDLRADARLVLRGYTVLRFDYQQVLFDAGYVRETVLLAIAQGLHRAR
jgi:very-short-patch-repair endonuclease